MARLSTFTVTRDYRLGENERIITNFLPSVKHVYWPTEAEDTSPPTAVQIQLMRDNQSVHPEIKIMYRDLDKFNFEREFPGYICTDEKGRSTHQLVIRFIRERISLIPKARRGVFLPSTGWYGNTFAAGSHLLGVEMTPPPLIASEAASLQLASISGLTAGETAEQLLLILHRMPDVGLPTFAFTLYSSLHSVFRAEGLPTACILHLHGEQNFGKTTIAKRLTTLYDRDGSPADTYDAGSSFPVMRDALADARDRVILLDDICKTTDPSSQRKRLNEAAKLLRIAANEIPIVRKRGQKSISTRCEAGLVITGEIDFQAKSDLTRCVYVKLDKPLVGGSHDDRKVAASALANYLHWFAEHAESERERLRVNYESFCHCERSHREERLQISLWELSWVFSSFLRFAQSTGAISEQACEQIENKMDKILKQIFARTLERIAVLDRRTPDNIAQLIAAGAAQKAFPYIQHNGCLCIRSDVISDYLRQVTGCSDLTVNDVTAALRPMLRRDASGKSTCKVQGRRMLCIPYANLNSKK